MEPLQRLIELMNHQNVIMAKARYEYLRMEAERKHFESTEVMAAAGKSHSEKVTLAQSSEKWLLFHRELARLESRYQFELFKFKILELEFQSTYLHEKQDGRDIAKPRYSEHT